MRSTLLVTLLASTVFVQPPAPRPLPFSDTAWETRGDRTAIVKDDGREVLQVETGFAHRRDVRLGDGTIDFDVQLTRRRSFVYLHFRMQSDEEREEIYLRPHKSGLPDAVQYAPVWQNRSAWQLYHGPGGTAAAAFTPGLWTHVRVVLQGPRAAVFIDDMTTPALLVPRLARQPHAGYLALGAFLPANEPGSGPIARFSNVVLRRDIVEYDFTRALANAAAEPAPLPGVVRAWMVSQSFVPKAAEMPEIPDASVLGEFRRLEAEPGGLLPLHRHVRMPEKSNAAAAVARIRIRAAEAGSYPFDLGFSDIATAFVNGQPVFRGDASYSFDRPRREGLIGFDQARLYLPLRAGDNDLAILVSDSFGGWGLMGRFATDKGLTVEAGSD